MRSHAQIILCVPSRTVLRNPEVQKDPRKYLQAVQKVIACMTLGIDVSKLFSEMIMVSGYVSSIGCVIHVPRYYTVLLCIMKPQYCLQTLSLPDWQYNLVSYPAQIS